MPEGFTFARFQFNIKLKEEFQLPDYLGSTLRGGLGTTLRKIVCPFRNKECERCPIVENCVYSYIFLTQKSNRTKATYHYKDYPHPYLIEPPFDPFLPRDSEPLAPFTSEYPISFNLLLIGKAIDYLTYFILAFEELGKVGLGEKRSKYQLTTIYDTLQDPPKSIYSSQIKSLAADFKRKDFQNIIEETRGFSSEKITLNFLTPTRIKYRKEYVKEFDFEALIRSILRRFLTLAELHCDYKPKINPQDLLKRAKEVSLLNSETHWYNYTRYSKRQDRRIDLSGFIGRVTFQGKISDFLPYIKLGEYIHIGKNTSFGLGRYKFDL